MMTFRTLAICLLLSLLNFFPAYGQEKEDASKYYLANWKSLKNYEVPEWYRDAKFGVWTHWGAYSVPGYRGTHAAEWYPRWMYMKQAAGDKPLTDYEKQGEAIFKHHQKTYGDSGEFGYHDFVPMWKAEKWSPDGWADLAVESGAKFFTITGMHHDGFALYDSDFTEWNSVDKGPKRDLVGDLAKALRKRELKFGISNHFAHNRNYYRYYFDNGYNKKYADRPELEGLYSSGAMDAAYVKRWWNITTEMAQKYSPDLYYFDWGWDGKFWENEWPQFFSYYYNDAIRSGKGVLGNPQVVVNYKNVPAAHGSGAYDLERASMRDAKNFVWQTDTSISAHSWGYASQDTFKSPAVLVSMLVDIVSKNGVLMLNFGPKADGTVPEECRSRLLEMGAWLKINGEAVYSTRPWTIAEEGPTEFAAGHKRSSGGPYDVRYTRSKDGNKLYATLFGIATDKRLTLQSTKVSGDTTNGKVVLLANDSQVPFEIDEQGKIVLDLSGVSTNATHFDYAFSVRIEGLKVEAVKNSPFDLAKFYLTKVDPNETAHAEHASEFPFVSGLNALIQRAHRGVKRDTNYHGGKIKIEGQEFEQGLMVCPAGNQGVGYFIVETKDLPEINGLKASIGIDDAVKSRGTSSFEVEALVDGTWQQLYKSDVLTWEDAAVEIDVKIPANAKYIVLKTTDGGDGSNADHAIWAGARFY